MADTIKISALDELTSGSLKDTTVFPVVDGGITKKVRLDSLQAYMNDTLVTDSELTSEISSVNSTINALTTDNITENTNLYYTNDRVKSKLNAEGVLSGSLSLNLTSDDISDFDSAVSESAAAAGFGTGGGGTSLTVIDVDSTITDVESITFTGATVSVTGAGGAAIVDISSGGDTFNETRLGHHTASINFFTSSFYASDIISGSQQIEDLGFVVGGGGGAEIPDGTISGSQQILGLGFITGGTFLSSSGQVQLALTNRLGWDTSLTPEHPSFLYYTDARVEAHLDAIGLLTGSGGGGTVSGSITSSGQIAYGEIKNTPKFWKGEGINIISGSSGDTNNYILISSTGGAGSTIAAEFYLFTSSYLLEKDSFITGASQIEALGFDPNAGDVSALNNWTGSTFSIISQSFSNRVTDLEENPAGVPNGTLSSSAQIDYTAIPNVPSFLAGPNITILQDPINTFQISASVEAIGLPNGVISGSEQIVDFGTFLTGSYFDLPSKITGSGIEYSTIKNIPDGFISSSQQITDFGFVSESGVAPQGTISSSQQIADFGYISSSIGFYSSSTQISESGYINRTEEYWLTFSASAETRLSDLEGGTTPFAVLEGGNQFTGSQIISGSVTAHEFIVSTVGEPIIYSATNLNLSASAGTVIVNSSPFRLASYTTSELFALSATDGDMAYDTTVSRFRIYEDGQWVDMRGHEYVIVDVSSSLALGIGAGPSVSTLSQTGNTSIGHFSSFTLTTGTNNTVVGANAHRTADIASNNTAVGAFSLEYNTIGSDNTAIGINTLQNNDFGSYNVAVGSDSLKTNEIGSRNVAVGHKGLEFNISGSSNVAIGNRSQMFNLSGSRNISIGDRAGQYINDNDNIYIGYKAGVTNISGSKNIYIGNSITGSLFGDDNQIIIGSFATASGANTTTIGNDDTTATHLKGVVNAGTTFRMPSYTDAQTSSLSPANGDMIYNTTVNKFVGYANSVWVELH